MKRDLRTIFKTLWRSLRLKCPVCGRASIVERAFHIKHHCSACDALFKREDGFFVGAIMVSVVTTEAVILAVYFLYLLATNFQFDDTHALAVLFAVALLFPMAFYHHGWSLWLGFDYIVESLPKYQKPGTEEWPDRIP